jgi:hypothetical protein
MLRAVINDRELLNPSWSAIERLFDIVLTAAD